MGGEITIDDSIDEKRSFHRSPNYPASSLPEAIERARLIYEKERRAGTSRDIALRHMGYNSPSGIALRSLATLRKFGLIEDRGERIYLSQLGLDILVFPSSDERHRKAVKECALNPSIYASIWERYKDSIPSDETVKAELVRDYGFNDKAVESFLHDFFKTLDYADLRHGAPLHQVAVHDDLRVGGTVEMATAGNRPRGPVVTSPYLHNAALSITYPIPLRKQNQATISFARMPLEKGDLELLKKWIDLMEDNLTEALPQEDHNADV